MKLVSTFHGLFALLAASASFSSVACGGTPDGSSSSSASAETAADAYKAAPLLFTANGSDIEPTGCLVDRGALKCFSNPINALPQSAPFEQAAGVVPGFERGVVELSLAGATVCARFESGAVKCHAHPQLLHFDDPARTYDAHLEGARALVTVRSNVIEHYTWGNQKTYYDEEKDAACILDANGTVKCTARDQLDRPHRDGEPVVFDDVLVTGSLPELGHASDLTATDFGLCVLDRADRATARCTRPRVSLNGDHLEIHATEVFSFTFANAATSLCRTCTGLTTLTDTASGTTIGYAEAPFASVITTTSPERIAALGSFVPYVIQGSHIQRKVPGVAFALVGGAARAFSVKDGALTAPSDIAASLNGTSGAEYDLLNNQPAKAVGFPYLVKAEGGVAYTPYNPSALVPVDGT